jgi:hypothetical protein
MFSSLSSVIDISQQATVVSFTTFYHRMVISLSAVVGGAIEQTIPRGYSYKPKFLPWFSYTIRYYYIVKENYFHCRFKKKPSDYFYDRFAFYRKLVKTPQVRQAYMVEVS